MSSGDNDIINKIKKQKELFNQWKKSLTTNLTNSSYKKEKLYLVEEEWVKKYQKEILDIEITDKNKNKLIKNYKDMKNINNNKLMDIYSDDKKSISTFPKVLVLNEKSWGSFQKEANKTSPIKSVSTFCNKLLLIDLQKYRYCFFFFDQYNQLRQGYIKIYNHIYNDLIINQFQNKNVIKFILGYEKEIGKCKYIKDGKLEIPKEVLEIKLENKFKIYIFSNKKEENINNFTTNIKDEKEKEEKQKAKIITINPKDIKQNSENNKNQNVKQNNKQDNKKNQKLFEEINKVMKAMDNTMSIKGRMNTCSGYQPNFNKKMQIMYEDQSDADNTKNPSFKRSRSAQIKERKNRNELLKKEEEIKEDTNKAIIKNKRIEKYEEGLIGLLNIGSTCYMNSTIQCFSNTMTFRKELLNKFAEKIKKNQKEAQKEIQKETPKDKNKKSKKETKKVANTKEDNKTEKEIYKLSYAFAEVLYNLWKDLKKSYYAPKEFKELIGEMNPLFKGISANDPKDLILFLLETMHNELNNPILKLPPNIKNMVPDPRDFNSVYTDFINFYFSKNKSIISDEFYGFTNIMITCGNCSVTTHNVQINNVLFMPLEEVRNFMGYNFNFVRINDCFEYYEKIDILPDYYCNYCGGSYNVYSRNKMVYAPKNLIINLNRGRGIEYNVNIIFEEYLNIRKYVFAPDSPFCYELTGVICHFGDNDQSGHFIAFCKNCNTCEWYKFNDSMVTKCSFNDVTQSGMPYVLFYSYVQAY